MSQENVEVVKVAFEVFARAGLDRFMEHFTDDVEYRVLAGADDLIHGPIHGKDAVRAWLQEWVDMFDGFWMELVELIDAGGGTVFTAERYGGRARLSGVETDSPNWTVFTIRDGKIARGREYDAREQALEAAGLSEEPMSQEKIEVVRRMLRAFNDGDVEGIVVECDPNVEWEEQSIPGAEPLYRGHEGIRRWWTATIAQEELGSIEGRLERLKEADGTVIASVRFEGEGRSSGARVQMPVHLVFTFRDGKVVRRQVFLTLAEALEAVGLSE